MSNAPSSTAETLTAVLARIESMDFAVNEYDVLAILDTIMCEYGGDVAEVTDFDFLRLMTLNALEDGTDLPCPDWCARDAGHRFECSFDDGRQSRPHELRLPRPDEMTGEVYLSLVQEDVRDKGDDSTAVRTIPEVSFAVDASFQADELRKLAAALLNAADRLDEVNARR